MSKVKEERDALRTNQIYDRSVDKFTLGGDTAMEVSSAEFEIADLFLLPVVQSVSLMEMFLGMVAWDDSKFALGPLFLPYDTAWCSFESIELAFKNWVRLCRFCFGDHMEAFTALFQKIIFSSAVRQICPDCPMFLANFVNARMRQLWGEARLPLEVDNKLVRLGGDGWIARCTRILETLEFSAGRVQLFEQTMAPALPRVLTDQLRTRAGAGGMRTSYEAPAGNQIGQKVSRSEESDSGGRKKLRSPAEPGSDQICIRYVAGQWKVRDFPVCTRVDCRFTHRAAGPQDAKRLESLVKQVHVSDGVAQQFVKVLRSRLKMT
jgi:hypothetical protein